MLRILTSHWIDLIGLVCKCRRARGHFSLQVPVLVHADLIGSFRIVFDKVAGGHASFNIDMTIDGAGSVGPDQIVFEIDIRLDGDGGGDIAPGNKLPPIVFLLRKMLYKRRSGPWYCSTGQ